MKMEERILLIEDKPDLRQMLKTALGKEGYQVTEAGDGETAARLLNEGIYSLVLTDLRLPGRDGISVLEAARESSPDLPVILMTAYGTIEKAVVAMKEGAYDFIQKPVDLPHLLLLIQRAIQQQHLQRENILLREEFAERYGFPKIIGEHESMRKVGAALQRLAPSDTTVLLLGESGTGKELFARAIHQISPRAGQPFVAINCAAIPETLVETELFGHEKGAFTGAGARKIGKFELAHRGTIFLDEIGELPLGTQAKILRVLQERAFERVGGVRTIQVDVRVVAATNRNLEEATQAKQFREDLYFRLAAFPVTIPPLRERGEDVLQLASAFVAKFCREFKKPRLTLSEGAAETLMAYRWPGNVRELQNALERAVILADGEEIQAEDLQLRPPRPETILPKGMELGEDFNWEGGLTEIADRATQIVERIRLSQVMEECRWNKQRACEKLQISYKTLLNKLHSYELG